MGRCYADARHGYFFAGEWHRAMNDCAIPQWGSCCCNCRWHIEDFHHCTTVDSHTGCVCNERKGWICMANGYRAHSGWTEHGICEMHEAKPESAE